MAPPPRRDPLPVMIFIFLIVVFIALLTSAVVLGLRSCGDGGKDGAERLPGAASVTSPRPSQPAPSPMRSTASSPAQESPSPGTTSQMPSESPSTGVDPWPGTWMWTDDPDTGLVIERTGSGTYVVAELDGPRLFEFQPLDASPNVAMVNLNASTNGENRLVRIVLTVMPAAGRMVIVKTDGDQTDTWQLRRSD
jgi:hypothetical protein